MSAPVERPVLCSALEVGAILAGRRTQMRSPLRGFAVRGPHPPGLFDVYRVRGAGAGWCGAFDPLCPERSAWVQFESPYGKRGDRLWVCEPHEYFTEAYDREDDSARHTEAEYVRWDASPRQGRRRWRDDGKVEDITFLAESTPLEQAPRGMRGSWAHMPRWASRLALLVTRSRFHRLQDIDAADVVAEGWRTLFGPGHRYRAFESWWDGERKCGGYGMGRVAPWGSNPWVWAATCEVRGHDEGRA